MNSLILLPAFISFQELTIILLFAVIIFGPKKIPEIARGLGEGIRAMKQATDDIKREIMNPVEDINPMKEVQETIEDSKKEMEETLDDALGPVKRK
ncbi:MAG: twin-arginine translocase TatA/TatE family subunit [Moheibacter sp.]